MRRFPGLGEPRQQPGELDFQDHDVLAEIDRAARRLGDRAHLKGDVVAGPVFLLDGEQMAELAARGAEALLDAAHRLGLAELVGNGNDQRFAHGPSGIL